MSEPRRPLPNLDEPDTRPFWDATRNREFRYQQCDGCGMVVWHPRKHCTGCVDGELRWHTASGNGTVYAYSVVRQSYHPFFRSLVPYVVAWIDLDEGPRVLSNITGIDDVGKDIACGQRVVVQWEAHHELSIPLFRPV